MRNVILAFCLSMPSVAWASCVPVDTSGWTQYEKNLLTSIAYRIAFDSGVNEVPVVKDSEVCFSSVNPSDFLKPGAIKANLDAHMQQNLQAEESEQSKSIQQKTAKASAIAKLKALGLTETEAKLLTEK